MDVWKLKTGLLVLAFIIYSASGRAKFFGLTAASSRAAVINKPTERLKESVLAKNKSCANKVSAAFL